MRLTEISDWPKLTRLKQGDVHHADVLVEKGRSRLQAMSDQLHALKT